MSQRARWTMDGPPGSAFHELVVVPTLAPQLLRDGQVPEMPAAEGVPEGSNQAADTAANSAEAVAPPAGSVAPQIDTRLSRTFFIHVTTCYTTTIKNGRAEKREKHETSKSTTSAHPVLAVTRSAFITAALSAHLLQDRYDANVPNGPPMKVFWSGSPGGKTHAPVVQTDAEWQALQLQLGMVKASVGTVQVVFNLDGMSPWAKLKRPLSPSLHEEHGEITYGTAVPNVAAYSTEQTARKDAAKLIEKAWKCVVHQGICYIAPSLEHIQIHDVRLAQWSSAVVGGRPATDAPPEQLVALWSQKPSAVKARGRTGPHPAGAQPTAEVAGSAGDSGATVILTALLPLLTTVFERGLAQTAKPVAPVSDVAAAAPRSLHLASSPPPEVNEELTRCLEAFARERRIPFQLIDDAIMTLSDHSYTPDAIASVPIERLQELLPDFAEGQLYALKRYTDEWYSRIVTKRSRRSL
ncbi:hypothetical protein BD309DRAFT_1084645 [Dichomitus squalens]|uniref:Uncharacterized protein n=1 Tax=Dichomitus squalens TaxID=114155 RepID=A0A4Q9NB75_9APHY|nr:hypothetical protein BD309DRAFT_1084645 [Dichomitus squalens]TBU51234.1 hypothetical protein BD310DRAFT_890996 [Dichomitus squalens]